MKLKIAVAALAVASALAGAAHAKPLSLTSHAPNYKPHFDMKNGIANPHNRGSANAKKWSLTRVHCIGASGTPCPKNVRLVIFRTPPIAKGARYKYNIPGWKSAKFKPGKYVVRMCVDTTKRVAELVERDNCGSYQKVVTSFKGSKGLTWKAN